MVTNATYAQRYYQSALDFFDQGQYGKALEHISKAIEKDPRNPDYRSTKGVFYHKMNDLGQAMDAYREALELAPSHAFSHFNLGLILMKLGKTMEAIQEWESVVRTNPNDFNALFNIGVCLAQIGRKREAIKIYERVLKIQAAHVQTHQNLGILYRDDRRFDKAKYHLNQLKILDSTYSEVVAVEILRCEEQEFLEKVSNIDTAKIAGEIRSSSNAPSGPQLSDGLTAIIEGKFNEALRIAEAILKEMPNELQAKILKAEALVSLTRNEEAIQEFNNILEENPNLPEINFQMGNLYLNLGDLDKALDYFQRVKKIDPAFSFIDENISSIESLKNPKNKRK